MKVPDWVKGEILGTFLLVFFGLGAVATSVATEANAGLFQVAIVWGLGLGVAISIAGPLSGAHLNPAITCAFAVFGGFPKRRVPGYIGCQFVGAFIAASAVYLLFAGSIREFEASNELVRGEAGTEASAMIFGEYFPNPGAEPLTPEKRREVSHGAAFFGEALGTALLALIVMGSIRYSEREKCASLLPWMIGFGLAVLICLFAPVTMAGFNPARDLAPRVFSSLAGWGSVPFSVNGIGWLTVYVIAPVVGALSGAAVAKWTFNSSEDEVAD